MLLLLFIFMRARGLSSALMRAFSLCILIVLYGSFVGAEVADVPDEDASLVRETHDFIVVGAGACGCVIASRLVSETRKSVLLLEGGAWGTGQRDIGGTDYVASAFKTDPVTGKQSLDVPLTRYDVPTMIDTIRTASNVLDNMWPINATGVFYSQAKVVGGNQATNGLAWFPVQKADFDGWGLPGYSAAEMFPIIRRIENATETGYGNSTSRGNAGPVNIKFGPSYQMEQTTFYDTVRRLGYPAGGDMNDGMLKEGIYQAQSNIKHGIRQSTSIAYLAKVLKNKRLTFRTSATVTHVLFDKHNNAIGVKYVDVKGKVRKAYARLEVVMAAGSLQTTKILYHSGIGPSSILKAFNITPRVVNDVIGQKIHNHQRVLMVYNDITGGNANYYGYQAASLQYASTGEGMIANRGFVFLHFNATNPTPYPYPDVQISPNPYAPGNGFLLSRSDAYAQQFVVWVSLNYNLYANGTLNLTTAEPLDATHYTSNLFAVQEDVERAARGVLEMRRIAQNWPGRVEEVSPGLAIDTVDKLIPWIREKGANSFCHYYATTPMSTDPSAPCDPRMLLRGVQKLRIVGPSSLPAKIVYPGMSMLATVLGEKGTDLIIEDHGL